MAAISEQQDEKKKSNKDTLWGKNRATKIHITLFCLHNSVSFMIIQFDHRTRYSFFSVDLIALTVIHLYVYSYEKKKLCTCSKPYHEKCMLSRAYDLYVSVKYQKMYVVVHAIYVYVEHFAVGPLDEK